MAFTSPPLDVHQLEVDDTNPPMESHQLAVAFTSPPVDFVFGGRKSHGSWLTPHHYTLPLVFTNAGGAAVVLGGKQQYFFGQLGLATNNNNINNFF